MPGFVPPTLAILLLSLCGTPRGVTGACLALVTVAEMALQHGARMRRRANRRFDAGFYGTADLAIKESVRARKLATVAQWAGVLGATVSAATELVWWI